MYSYKIINGKGCVIHDATGCSLPYHSKTSKYGAELITHSWKLEYFTKWLYKYSNSQRKKIKHMKPSEAIQFLSVTGSKFSEKNFSLESCKNAAPTGFNAPVCTATTVRCQIEAYDRCKQEGTTPMCYDTPKGKTEAEISRAYLVNRLGEANYAKRDQLRKFFNLDAIAIPKSYKELIDAIKNGKFEINAKVAKNIDFTIEEEGQYYGSPLDGITFTDFPKPDYEGFTAATAEQSKKYTQAKDAFFLPYEQGLKALVDFEAWMPEGK